MATTEQTKQKYTVRTLLHRLNENVRKSAYRCLLNKNSLILLDAMVFDLKEALSLCYFSFNIGNCKDTDVVYNFYTKLIEHEENEADELKLVSSVFNMSYLLN